MWPLFAGVHFEDGTRGIHSWCFTEPGFSKCCVPHRGVWNRVHMGFPHCSPCSPQGKSGFNRYEGCILGQLPVLVIN